MNTLNFEVFTRLMHRWDTVQAMVEETGISPAERETMARLIAIFDLMAQTGDTFVPPRAAQLAEWLWASGESFGVPLRVIFQIRKAIRPILIREYPGVEGFLNGQMHFEDISNYLLTLISDAYCAAATNATQN